MPIQLITAEATEKLYSTVVRNSLGQMADVLNLYNTY
jgi:hypothetical protein